MTKRRPFLLACALALATVGIVTIGGPTPSDRIDVGAPAIHSPARSAAPTSAARTPGARPGWLAASMWAAAAALFLIAPSTSDHGRTRWWARPGYQRGPPCKQFA